MTMKTVCRFCGEKVESPCTRGGEPSECKYGMKGCDPKPPDDYWRETYRLTNELRRHLATVPAGPAGTERTAYEAYWDGWNDACDANMELSIWKRAIAELKRPR